MGVKSQASHESHRPREVLSQTSSFPQYSPDQAPGLHSWPAPQTAPCPGDQNQSSGPGVSDRPGGDPSRVSSPRCVSSGERLHLSELSLLPVAREHQCPHRRSRMKRKAFDRGQREAAQTGPLKISILLKDCFKNCSRP